MQFELDELEQLGFVVGVVIDEILLYFDIHYADEVEVVGEDCEEVVLVKIDEVDDEVEVIVALLVVGHRVEVLDELL